MSETQHSSATTPRQIVGTIMMVLGICGVGFVPDDPSSPRVIVPFLFLGIFSYAVWILQTNLVTAAVVNITITGLLLALGLVAAGAIVWLLAILGILPYCLALSIVAAFFIRRHAVQQRRPVRYSKPRQPQPPQRRGHFRLHLHS